MHIITIIVTFYVPHSSHVDANYFGCQMEQFFFFFRFSLRSNAPTKENRIGWNVPSAMRSDVSMPVRSKIAEKRTVFKIGICWENAIKRTCGYLIRGVHQWHWEREALLLLHLPNLMCSIFILSTSMCSYFSPFSINYPVILMASRDTKSSRLCFPIERNIDISSNKNDNGHSWRVVTDQQ